MYVCVRTFDYTHARIHSCTYVFLYTDNVNQPFSLFSFRHYVYHLAVPVSVKGILMGMYVRHMRENMFVCLSVFDLFVCLSVFVSYLHSV